ncbi:MAG: metal ABC transporter permease, partial [Chlamydiota bacterium]|nr:metal ABC transporter permease [Chlamydiota bacterium]
MEGWALLWDPLSRGPLIGTMILGLICGLSGYLLLIQKKVLSGEVVSHAAYPGLMIALMAGGIHVTWMIIGAAMAAGLGLFSVSWLQKKGGCSADTALCLTLSLFMGVGVLLASHVQWVHPRKYQQAGLFLYGQAATLQDDHLMGYGLMAVGFILFLVLVFRYLELSLFDPSLLGISFSKSKIHWVSFLLSVWMVMGMIVSLRAIGVVPLSGLLVGPALAATRWTQKMRWGLLLSALFGVSSSYLGNRMALGIPSLFPTSLVLPTGPSVVLAAAIFAFFSLFFGWRSGWLCSLWRRYRFHLVCWEENLIKGFWKQENEQVQLPKKGRWVICFLQWRRWLDREG